MSQLDKVLEIIAPILGVLDVVNLKGSWARYSLAGIAVVLLAMVGMHRGGVLRY
jgi:hypothetical protein